MNESILDKPIKDCSLYYIAMYIYAHKIDPGWRIDTIEKIDPIYMLDSGNLAPRIRITHTRLATVDTKGQIHVNTFSPNSFAELVTNLGTPCDVETMAQIFRNFTNYTFNKWSNHTVDNVLAFLAKEPIL